MRVKAPAVYKANQSVKVPPETINSELSQAGKKASARYPHSPLGNQPGGGGSTSGKFRRAMTPGTEPAGS
jgi:hypothetical protein